MDNSNPVEITANSVKKSRGGLESPDGIRRNTVQRVRGDFLASTYKAKITFALDSITFNTSCVNLFPRSQHIVINVDEPNQRLIIEPCKSYDRDSLKFANYKNERNNSRKCVARIFCAMVYDMMGWNRTAKYRIMAIFHDWGEKSVIVFNLDESLQLFFETVESDDGAKKRSTTIIMPEDWRGRFGHTLEEHDAKNRIDTASTFVTIDNKTGEHHTNHISAKLPTPEELMHRPYGGMRPNQEIEEINNDEKN
jgi:hypothetical protein